MSKVAIIGGGITGLAAAYRLNELCPSCQVDLFEATPRLGGVLHTETLESFLVEHSADMFTTMDPAALELCNRIGFEDQLIGTDQKFQRAFIAQGSQLVPVPKGLNLMTPSDLDAIQNTSLLSAAGKARFLEEESIPQRSTTSDESLESFATRRFGEEAYRKIIQPLVGGIYTADPTKLSMRATLPQYLDMEDEFGSIIAATKHRQATRTGSSNDSKTSGARYNLFVAPQQGMNSFVMALRDNLKNTQVHADCSVSKIHQTDEGWQVQFGDTSVEEFQAIIVTCPGQHAVQLVAPIIPALADLLRQIHYASSAIVVHGFSRKVIDHPLDGFGFVVPMNEQRKILAGSFASVKFPGRASSDTVLTRTFIGGGCQPELLQHDDGQLAEIARNELADLLGIQGDPIIEKVVRWNNSMPQYHLGHTDLVKEIEEQVAGVSGLEIAGKSFRGVGIPACVRSGEAAAQRLADYLS